jgi:hypothetical protein
MELSHPLNSPRTAYTSTTIIGCKSTIIGNASDAYCLHDQRLLGLFIRRFAQVSAIASSTAATMLQLLNVEAAFSAQ